MSKLRTWLFRGRRQPQAPVPHQAVAGPPPPRACGWFDSSHELNSGLRVTEHASPDAVAGDLPLSDWLDLQLSGWRPDGPDLP